MSQENIERVHRLGEAVERQDLDAALDLVSPEVEFTSRLVGVRGDRGYHGHDGIREWWEDLFGTFPDFKFEVLTVRDLGRFMIVNAVVRGHGAGSDAPFEMQIWQTYEWRDSRLVWWLTCDTEDEAVAAAERRE